MRIPEAEEAAAVLRHVDAFTAEAEAVGVPPELAQRLFVEAGLAFVSFPIEEASDQTPGPSAGQQL